MVVREQCFGGLVEKLPEVLQIRRVACGSVTALFAKQGSMITQRRSQAGEGVHNDRLLYV